MCDKGIIIVVEAHLKSESILEIEDCLSINLSQKDLNNSTGFKPQTDYFLCLRFLIYTMGITKSSFI